MNISGIFPKVVKNEQTEFDVAFSEALELCASVFGRQQLPSELDSAASLSFWNNPRARSLALEGFGWCVSQPEMRDKNKEVRRQVLALVAKLKTAEMSFVGTE
jgi:hypothetical protein